VTRFAFYGRVSTEDQQDPESSKAWQLTRSRALIEPGGGEVVAEFFDIGQSRSLPWKRRPEAAALLDALKDPARGFDAVVIGEPARAFYGQQFGLTFPVFVHYGVGLWVPEVGGAVDPGSEAHDLVMSVFGGMSKGERTRIKVRTRSAMAAQAATEGRFLGGRPPYGYLLGDAGPHPNPAKAADGKRLRRLEVDPTAAPVVRRIFEEYLAGAGLYAIAERLTGDGIPSPSGHDPERNRHRQATKGAWSKSAVRAILQNPRYTGRQVWARQRKDEVLLDVDDVAAGHETKMRWNDRADWIWSAEPTHEAIIDPETFAQAQEQRGAGVHRPAVPRKRRTQRPYLLTGLVRCGICGRSMQGHWAHDRAHYRCRFPEEYARTRELDHPTNVYLREDVLVPPLDEWLAGLVRPERIDELVADMAAGRDDAGSDARVEAARRKLADCETRMGRYRAALESGADPTIVAGWLAEVGVERQAAERELAAARPKALPTADDYRAMLAELDGIDRMLRLASADERAKVYAGLGLTLTYSPATSTAIVEANPSVGLGVLSPLRHHLTRANALVSAVFGARCGAPKRAIVIGLSSTGVQLADRTADGPRWHRPSGSSTEVHSRGSTRGSLTIDIRVGERR
jgi:DNA invertase Pin-like site-specific DNA recombinase